MADWLCYDTNFQIARGKAKLFEALKNKFGSDPDELDADPQPTDTTTAKDDEDSTELADQLDWP